MAITRKHWTDEDIRALAREEVREAESQLLKELERLRGELNAVHRDLATVTRPPWWRRIFTRKSSHAGQ